jgi:hypothetical protein
VYDVLRQGWRLECGDKCTLKYCGQSVASILIDISISGVLVSCDDRIFDEMREGDECGIFLCGNSQECPHEVICIVVRKEEGRIGLQFPGDA